MMLRSRVTVTKCLRAACLKRCRKSKLSWQRTEHHVQDFQESSSMTLTSSEHYDVVIVGAGMVGASLACALTRGNTANKLKLLLVEASPVFNTQAPQQPGFDTRSTVLS